MVIFYGSQTGTAEEFAIRLAFESKRYALKALAVDPEENEMVVLSTEAYFFHFNFMFKSIFEVFEKSITY